MTENWGSILGRSRSHFLPAKAYRSPLKFPQPSAAWVSGRISRAINGWGVKLTDHSPPSTDRGEYQWGYIFTPIHVLRLVVLKYRDFMEHLAVWVNDLDAVLTWTRRRASAVVLAASDAVCGVRFPQRNPSGHLSPLSNPSDVWVGICNRGALACGSCEGGRPPPRRAACRLHWAACGGRAERSEHGGNDGTGNWEELKVERSEKEKERKEELNNATRKSCTKK